MTDPSTDPVGTVRREDHEGGYSIWIRVGRSMVEGYGSNAVVFVKPAWRCVWIDWASEQPYPKASWLVPWEGLSEPDREVDRRIGETLARIGISAYLTRSAAHPDYQDAT